MTAAPVTAPAAATTPDIAPLMTGPHPTMPTAGVARARVPLLTLGYRRARLELLVFSRSREAVVFSLFFPVLLLGLFGSIFGGEIDGTGVTAGQVLVSGVLASGLMTVSFQNLAISVALEREDGTLKRLIGLPIPRSAYFLGKIGQVAVLSVLEMALVLVIGRIFFGLSLPTDVGRWLTFAAVFLLGATACSLLGIAYSRLARRGKSASAVVAPPFIVLQFISGVWLRPGDLPSALQTVAQLFPLHWMVRGFQSAFLPESFGPVQYPGGWNLPMVFAVLGAWVVGASALCRLTFRWTGHE